MFRSKDIKRYLLSAILQDGPHIVPAIAATGNLVLDMREKLGIRRSFESYFRKVDIMDSLKVR